MNALQRLFSNMPKWVEDLLFILVGGCLGYLLVEAWWLFFAAGAAGNWHEVSCDGGAVVLRVDMSAVYSEGVARVDNLLCDRLTRPDGGVLYPWRIEQ